VPADVADGLRQGFSGGWHGAYPPFHYYILGIVMLPFSLAEQAHLTSRLSEHMQFTLSLLFRAVSVVMGLGVIYLTYLCSLEVHADRRSAALSAIVAASTPLFVFYAKLANLDIPYVFWFMVALLHYIRFVKHPQGSALTGFVVGATLAICTKDQAYALFILPALHVVWLRFRSTAGGSIGRLVSDRGLRTALLAGVVAFVVGQNLIFNFWGFVWHVQYVTGISVYQPAYDNTIGGHLEMVGDTVRQLSWAMGWPALVVGIAGLLLTISRQPAHGRALALVLVSYHLFFIAVIRYQFDRFFLAPALVLAVCSGALFSVLLHQGRAVPIRRLACAALVVYCLLHGSFVSIVMATDSRYKVEAWLEENVPEAGVIAYVGRRTYLPRFPHGSIRVIESWSYVGRRRPDVLVINVPYSCRAQPGTRRADFYDHLNDPDNGVYELVLASRSDPLWPVRGADAVFGAACENDVSNLSKISPEIRVYRRIAPS
jgi:hypothetical protein